MYIRAQIDPTEASLSFRGLGDFAALSKGRAAEARRLQEEITTLAAGANWTDVDHAYRKWLKVQNTDDEMKKWPIHKIAAEAAKKIGDASSRYRRVWLALKLLKSADGPSEERTLLKEEKQDLESNWALIDIRLRRKLKGPIEYPIPRRMIRRGDGAAAFERASEELSKRGRFIGLLLLEPFIIDGQEISLKGDCALSLVSVVHVVQQRDGTFEIDRESRPPTAERDPLLID